MASSSNDGSEISDDEHQLGQQLGALNESVVCGVLVKTANKVRTVGFAMFDRDEKRIKVCEFKDNEHFSTLEATLLQVRPVSCAFLAPDDPVDAKKIDELLKACEIEAVQRKKAEFKAADLEQDIERLLCEDDSIKNHLGQLQQAAGMEALAGLLGYYQLMADHTNFHQCALHTYDTMQFMRVDKAAANALQILPKPKETARSPTSLYGFLNKCRTSLGSRRLNTWVAQPLLDVKEIQMRLDVVEIFKEDAELRQSLHSEYLRKVHDLDKTTARFHRISALDEQQPPPAKGKLKAKLDDLVKTYDAVIHMRGAGHVLKEYVSSPAAAGGSASAAGGGGGGGGNRESLREYIVKPLKQALEGFENFLQLVEHTVDLDEYQRSQRCILHRTFDQRFTQLAKEKDDIAQAIEDHRRRVESDLGLDRGNRKSGKGSDELVTIKDDGQHGKVFRVTKKDQKTVEGSKKGRYRQVRINKGEYLFTTSQLAGYVKQLTEKETEYEDRQKNTVYRAVRVGSTHWPCLEQLADVVAKIDILSTFALIANNHRYNKPTLEPDGSVVCLEGSRHALVEIQHHTSHFIPNDVHMDRDASRLHIITGPNMGGKSTYIRQVALVSLMAQIGSFVPCKSARLPIFNQIQCRVGASDVQLRGISTFMAEMSEASAILKTADKNSLVVIDELGRGTSTFEGFGLAWGIAKAIADELGCFCLFATHFHEMGALAECPGVVNRHVTAAIETGHGRRDLKFLYNLQDGCADQSYGVHVAEMAGLPAAVIEQARQKSQELEAVEKSHPTGNKRKRDGDQLDGAVAEDTTDSTGGSTGEAIKRLKGVLREIFQPPDAQGLQERAVASQAGLAEAAAVF
ncbi:unnamed protein product [Vitrella brassicaformis CCMP3155]|uniref:DNA mismatch repair proteins mutS family domain-containing protein n=1 Tax=Vitrella brassicaformis (strain CCMP3155) TaxID=1169540 RepID=A0A0G4GZF7_VITBC|nr:unnamed protein product [Vitrella brassicaformis CCMP3155]|eukprot:CEM36592.1 unnamed protein product [Vitrella brassicaformis CCMP3155]